MPVRVPPPVGEKLSCTVHVAGPEIDPVQPLENTEYSVLLLPITTELKVVASVPTMLTPKDLGAPVWDTGTMPRLNVVGDRVTDWPVPVSGTRICEVAVEIVILPDKVPPP